MVALVKPLDAGTYPLWQTVWCNVPEGQPLAAKDAAQALPWLRPTRTSEKGQIVTPDMSHDAEAFFGMPRRLRLVVENDMATGVVQRRYGTHYARWVHPLSPYHCREAGGGRLPVHARPGKVSFEIGWDSPLGGQTNGGWSRKRFAGISSLWMRQTRSSGSEDGP